VILFFAQYLKQNNYLQSFSNTNLIINWVLVFCIVFWTLFFYINIYKFEKINLNIEKQNDLQKLKLDIFSKKFPLLVKIPFIGFISKWFYKNGFIFSFIYVLVVFICFANTFVNLWKLPYHQDEQYHFSPAYTYNKTLEFAKWDFLYDEIWSSKWTDRNKSLTVLTSYSQKIFWFNEFASRLPVAIAGFLWVFLIYFIVLKITWIREIWLISMYVYWVNDVVLYFSGFIRAYIFLILLSMILFYILYKLILDKNNKKKLIYIFLSIIIFIFWLVELHATMIVLFPLLIFAIFLSIFQTFSFKKYKYIYISFFVLTSVFVLNTIWLIHIFKMPFGIQNQINLSLDLFNPTKIYLGHLVNPFNIWIPLIFLLIILFFIRIKDGIYLKLFLVFSVFIPMIFSLYFFNRYEDFRYIAVIQWIFIIFVSIFIYYIWILLDYKSNNEKYLKLIIVTLLFIPLQFPYILEIKPITKTSQADWENVEWSRIHFRLAQPDNYKAFNYIFENFDNIVLLRLADWWINWDDNYYLSTYVKKYNKDITLYSNSDYFSEDFNEVYNYLKPKKELESNVSFYDILSIYK